MRNDDLTALEDALETYSQTHRMDMVADIAKKILALKPDHMYANYELMRAYYNSKHYHDLKVMLTDTGIFFSNEDWYHHLWYLYYLVYGEGYYVKAKEHIEIALSIDPNHAQYYRNLAELYLINWEPEKAVDPLKKAVEINPSEAEYRSRLALALLRVKKKNESLSTAEEALKEGLTDPWVYDSVGMIYMLSGELEKGEELFRQACRMTPTQEYFTKHIDLVTREKNDRDERKKRGEWYTPLYLRHKSGARFFTQKDGKTVSLVPDPEIPEEAKEQE